MGRESVVVIATLAGLALVMILAMVCFSLALLADTERRTGVRWWGGIYAATGAAIILVLGSYGTSVVPANRVPATLGVVAGGWGVLHAGWLWLWLSLGSTISRSYPGVAGPRHQLLRHHVGRLTVASLIVVLVSIVQLGLAGQLLATMTKPGHRALAALLTLAVLGFAFLMLGGFRLALDQGKPMGRGEIDEQLRQSAFESMDQSVPRYGWSTYRFLGPAKGVEVQIVVSLEDVKKAWRSGAWRRQPLWRTIFIMIAGCLLLAFGGFGSAVVAGSPVVKILGCGALLYLTYQCITAIRSNG